MTSFAFHLRACWPLVFASRPRAPASRRSLGTHRARWHGRVDPSLNLAFIPVLYVVIEGWREQRRKHRRRGCRRGWRGDRPGRSPPVAARRAARTSRPRHPTTPAPSRCADRGSPGRTKAGAAVAGPARSSAARALGRGAGKPSSSSGVAGGSGAEPHARAARASAPGGERAAAPRRRSPGASENSSTRSGRGGASTRTTAARGPRRVDRDAGLPRAASRAAPRPARTRGPRRNPPTSARLCRPAGSHGPHHQQAGARAAVDHRQQDDRDGDRVGPRSARRTRWHVRG